MASGDPFEALYGQVSSALSSLQEEHEGLLSAPSEAERSALRNELGALQWDVQDLKEAVSVAASDPARFGLSASEVGRRRGLIDELEAKLRVCESHAAPVASPARGNAFGNGAGNKEFARAEGEVQMQLVREQDEQLDELAIAVERIGVMGKEMHAELDQQGGMLQELEDDFDNTRGRMGEAQRRLNRFVEETGRGQLCTIAALVALFLLLSFLLVTT